MTEKEKDEAINKRIREQNNRRFESLCMVEESLDILRVPFGSAEYDSAVERFLSRFDDGSSPGRD